MGTPKMVLIIFLFTLATLPPASLAGRRKLKDEASVVSAAAEKVGQKLITFASGGRSWGNAEADGQHPRFLMVKTNDYGSYDPSPTMDKPPYKLIPNRS